MEPYPYLQHVKGLVKGWPQLQLLVDFMEVGTVPDRWGKIPGEPEPAKPKNGEKSAMYNPEDRGTYSGSIRYAYVAERLPMMAVESERRKRAKKCNIALLEYTHNGGVRVERYQEPGHQDSKDLSALENYLLQLKAGHKQAENQAADSRLIVVEDLSRDVIDTLGRTLNIDPLFFRAHLMDYAWNNIRDLWKQPRTPKFVIREREWCHIRFVRARYFPDEDVLTKGYNETTEFNVHCRINFDENESFWDRDKPPRSRRRKSRQTKTTKKTETVRCRVGLVRSRATLWKGNLAGHGDVCECSRLTSRREFFFFFFIGAS